MRRTPRHLFLPTTEAWRAYADAPVPIGGGQTASQPYMVALMTECLGLAGGERVLEVGTGSGYQTAVLSQLAARVYSIERIADLADRAAANLLQAGCRNVELRVGDGTLGWPEEAPFDRVLLTAGAPAFPDRLFGQVEEGGRLVAPVGGGGRQSLIVAARVDGRAQVRPVCDCVFVKLLGEEGWRE